MTYELPYFIWEEILTYLYFYETKKFARVNRKWLKFFGKKLAQVELSPKKDDHSKRKLGWFEEIVEKINFSRFDNIDWDQITSDYPNIKNINVTCYRKSIPIPIGFMQLNYLNIESLSISLSHSGLLDSHCLSLINLFKNTIKELEINVSIFQPWVYSDFFEDSEFPKLRKISFTYAYQGIPFTGINKTGPKIQKLVCHLRSSSTQSIIYKGLNTNLTELELIPLIGHREITAIKLRLEDFPKLVKLAIPGETILDIDISFKPSVFQELHLFCPSIQLLSSIFKTFDFIQDLVIFCTNMIPEIMTAVLRLCRKIKRATFFEAFDSELLSELPAEKLSLNSLTIKNSRCISPIFLKWLSVNCEGLMFIKFKSCYSITTHEKLRLSFKEVVSIEIQTFCPKALKAFETIFRISDCPKCNYLRIYS